MVFQAYLRGFWAFDTSAMCVLIASVGQRMVANLAGVCRCVWLIQLVHMNDNGMWVGRKRNKLKVVSDGFSMSERATDHSITLYELLLRVSVANDALAFGCVAPNKPCPVLCVNCTGATSSSVHD